MRKHVQVKESACLAQTCAMRHYEAMTQEQAGGLVLEFGITDRLRKAREHAGYASQKAFAELTGISRGTIGNYESPEWTTRKPYILEEWARATGVSVEWLRTGNGRPSGPTPDGGEAADAALARLRAKKRSRHAVDGTNHRYAA